MFADEVDERTTRWEVTAPVFRVQVERTPSGPHPAPGRGRVVSAWDVAQASLADVQAWVQDTAPPGASVRIGVVMTDAERGQGVVRVLGTER